MTKLRTFALLGLFTLWPNVASAQWGWWEFLESLSGPGPFSGYSFGARVACTRSAIADRLSAPDWFCVSDNEALRQILEIRGSLLTTGEGNRPRFVDAPADKREVMAFRFESLVWVRLSPLLDVGAGAGFTRFWGDGFDPVLRPSIPFSATFTPFAIGNYGTALKRVFKVRIEETYFPIGFTGADFGHPEVAYSSDGDWVFSGGLVIDFGNLRR